MIGTMQNAPCRADPRRPWAAQWRIARIAEDDAHLQPLEDKP
jgi:hypothetical protein